MVPVFPGTPSKFATVSSTIRPSVGDESSAIATFGWRNTARVAAPTTTRLIPLNTPRRLELDPSKAVALRMLVEAFRGLFTPKALVSTEKLRRKDAATSNAVFRILIMLLWISGYLGFMSRLGLNQKRFGDLP